MISAVFFFTTSGWKSSHFEHCGLRPFQKLRKLLRQGGVYMTKSKSNEVFNDLANALKFEYEPWTEDQILNALRKDSAFSFTSPNISCKINSNLDLYKIAYYNRQKKITNIPPPPSTSISNSTTSAFAPSSSNYPQSNPVQNSFTKMPQPPRPDVIPTNDKAPSFHQYSDANDISRSLQNLSRSYTDEIKYAAFSTMLKGMAADFYYSNLSRLPPTFDGLYQMMKINFEGDEYHQRILNKWNSLTLRDLIQQNPQHDTITCMEMLVQSLRTLQHSFDPEFQTDRFIRFKMIAACKDVPACEHACLTPAPTFSVFLNSLRSSVTLYNENHPKPSTGVFYTDRKFHKNDPQGSMSRENSRGRSST
ncbi:hypothetical protein GcM1_137001, partial [Golovinomyces cichoracearum]